MVYKSRVSGLLILLIFLSILPLFTFLPEALKDEEVAPLMALFIGGISIIPLFLIFSMKYEINGTFIHFKFLFSNKKLDITNIISLKETYNPLSSYATSLDRLEVISDDSNFKHLFISPCNQEEFIKKLQQINPKISYIKRKKNNKLLDWDLIK